MERTIVRQMDELGRIVLPREFRDALGWALETKVAIQLEGSKLTLCAEPGVCFLCGSAEELYEVKDRYICKACIGSLHAMSTP
ncbi:MAG: AbrB/MazE/SpoVT family DNA-binding domain-containing protein [Oscillospiraceae bacterium]|nr:AbrB/MazE/SpoVT family DNA-binding domain-containing protein [Oscillospiraceae bacterium]